MKQKKGNAAKTTTILNTSLKRKADKMHNSLVFICGCCFLIIITTLAIVYETKRIILLKNNYWDESTDVNNDNDDSIVIENDINNNNNNNNDNYHVNLRNFAYDLQTLATGYFLTTNDSWQQQQQQHQHLLYGSNWYEAFYKIKHRMKRSIREPEYDNMGNRVYNVGVLMASHLGKFRQ